MSLTSLTTLRAWLSRSCRTEAICSDVSLILPASAFALPWTAEAGKRYRIASRATDSAGAVQPDQPVWNPSGYLYNAVEPIAVEARA